MTTLSPRNPRVVLAGRLARQRRARAEEGRFVIDGPTLLIEAIAAGLVVDDVLVDPEALDRPEITAAVRAARAVGVEVWTVEGGLGGVADVVTPHGLCAVARTPSPAVVADGAEPALHLVLDAVGDPGNAGTLIRTAEAAGATSVVLGSGSVDVWSPKVVRSSAGSVLRVPITVGPIVEVLDALRAAGITLVGTRAGHGQAPEGLDLTRPVALVLGSEAHGLSAEATERIDEWVTLPMQGDVESLNVAVAGSVLAFEACRQRRS